MQNLTARQIESAILGFAVADALGVPVEFSPRTALDASPVITMMGYGTYSVPAGSWSDDTSMTLCALDSLAEGKYDLTDVMQKFVRWCEEGAYTPTGRVFDIGNTCRTAIDNFSRGLSPLQCGLTSDYANGNGSLMRILPFALFLAQTDLPFQEKICRIHDASALTHAHERSKVACGIYSFLVWRILSEPTMASVDAGLADARAFYQNRTVEFETYDRFLFKEIAGTNAVSRSAIRSSGYVVDTLEAAVWCLKTTNSYAQCVLTAVNLGKDTDTVAAVAGGLAGLFYGVESIPQDWLNTLLRREWICEMCRAAAEAFPNIPTE